MANPTRRARRSPHRSTGADTGGHRGFDRHRMLRDRDRDGTDRREGLDAFDLDAAADGETRDAGCLGTAGDAESRLAEPGLGVDPALAGDDEVGAGQAGVEVGRLHDEIHARPQREPGEAVLDREQPEPDPAGRAGTRHVPDGRRRARCRFEEVREASEAAVEEGDQVGGRALLGAVDRGRSGPSEQRVRHVAGDRHPDVRQVPVEIVQVDSGERLGDAACRRPVGSWGVVHRQCLEHPEPAIRRRAPTDAEDHLPDTRRGDGPEHVAQPARRRVDRVALTGRHPRQAGRLGHLDDAAGAVGGAEPASRDRSSERVGRIGLLPLPAAGRGDRLERSLAAVRERAQEDRVVEGGRATSRRRGRERPGPRSATP